MGGRLFDILHKTAQANPNSIAFSHKKRGGWVAYTYSGYEQQTNALALGLLELGVQKSDKIATISPNRPEWNFIDMAVMSVGAVHVPLYPTFNKEDLKFVLENCEARFVFVAGKLLFDLVKSVQKELPHLQEVYTIDTHEGIPQNLNLLVSLGTRKGTHNVKERMESVKPSDVATISYSSGTYWKPVGAELSHEAIYNMAVSLSADYELTGHDKALSYLPLCHSYEKGHSYAYQMAGISISYAESMASVIKNLQEVQPTIFTSVPALLEGFFTQLVGQSNGNSEEDKASQEAEDFALAYDIASRNEPKQEAIKNVLAKWKSLMGGQVRIISSAGAALPVRLTKAFWAMGIQLLECYGMTEAQIICLNHPNRGVKAGTVGPPQGKVQVKLAGDGEILVKSPYMMLGYFNNLDKTREVFDSEGWFHTGDVGQWDETCLRIIGRKKVIFKAANGKHISPEKVENMLRKSPLIDQALVHEFEGKVNAIIVPSRIAVERKMERLKNTIEREVDQYYNDTVEAAERINAFDLELEPWTIESGELTPNMKLRRKVILVKGSSEVREK